MLIVPESFSGGSVTKLPLTLITPALLTKLVDGDPSVTMGPPDPLKFSTPSTRLFSVPLLMNRVLELMLNTPELLRARERPRDPPCGPRLTTAPWATVVTPLPLIVPLFQFRPLLI